MSFNIPKGTKDVLPEDSYNGILSKTPSVKRRAFSTSKKSARRLLNIPNCSCAAWAIRRTSSIRKCTPFRQRQPLDHAETGRHGGRCEMFCRKQSVRGAASREDLLHHARFQIRTSAGGQTSRTSPVRRGTLRQLRRGNGRRGDFDCKIAVRKARA